MEARSEAPMYSEFVEALYRNHEIEMSLQGHSYFLSPFMDECAANEYAILDVKDRKVIFCDTIENVLLFQFDGCKSLKMNFRDFCIEDIF